MFRRNRSVPLQAKPSKGQRIYAVGDVHGCYDLLVSLLGQIRDHWTNTGGRKEQTSLLFLGDIIDRGPDSKTCLELISKLWSANQVIVLRGNHEDMMIEAAQGNAAAQAVWLANGGIETLASFDIDPPRTGEDAFDFAERLVAGVAAPIWDMLHNTVHSWRSGDYLFAHAGVDPNVPLDKQDNLTLLSIREEFTQSDKWHGAVIVHGHSIVDRVEIRTNRIACDTGAYRTGVLSCICVYDDTRTVVSSR